MTHFVKKVELKQPPKAESKLCGLRKRKPEKVNYIIQIERIWEKYAFNRNDVNFNKLVRALKFTIDRKAAAMERKWNNKRINKADFESVFYEELWKLCDSYNHYGEFYFYETFIVAIHNRGIDVTRKLITKKGAFEKNVLPLKEETAEFIPDIRINIEKDVIDRDLFAKILSEESLTDQELNLIQAIYSNPNASYRELAIEIGLKHPQQIKRSLQKIKNKIYFLMI